MSAKQGLATVAWAAVAVTFTWLLHEFAHWATGTFLGYPMQMTLNTAGLVDGEYRATWHRLAVSSAGPLITLLQAGLVFALLRKTPSKVLYLFLFVPFLMRLMAGVINVINLNDEGRVSQALGLGVYTLPALVTFTLLVMVARASRRAGFEARFQAMTTLAVMVFATLLIMADQLLTIRVL